MLNSEEKQVVQKIVNIVGRLSFYFKKFHLFSSFCLLIFVLYHAGLEFMVLSFDNNNTTPVSVNPLSKRAPPALVKKVAPKPPQGLKRKETSTSEPAASELALTDENKAKKPKSKATPAPMRREVAVVATPTSKGKAPDDHLKVEILTGENKPDLI